jgi:hypothetical protein
MANRERSGASNPNHTAACSAPATEVDLNAQRPQNSLRATQTASERAGIFGPTGAGSCHVIAGKIAGAAQEVCGGTRPRDPVGHDGAHGVGNYIGVNNALPGGTLVCRVGPRKRAGGPKCGFARRPPKGENRPNRKTARGGPSTIEAAN